MFRPTAGHETVTARLTPTEATALLAYIDRNDAKVDRESDELIEAFGDTLHELDLDADMVYDHFNAFKMPDELYEPLRQVSQHLPSDCQVSVTLDRDAAAGLLSNTLDLMRWRWFPKLGAMEAVVLSALEEIHHAVTPLEGLPDYWAGRSPPGA